MAGANAATGTGERCATGANRTDKQVVAARVRGAASGVTEAVEVNTDSKSWAADREEERDEGGSVEDCDGGSGEGEHRAATHAAAASQRPGGRLRGICARMVVVAEAAAVERCQAHSLPAADSPVMTIAWK